MFYFIVFYWDVFCFFIGDWKGSVLQVFGESCEISFYFYLLFCEVFCIYCGCNKCIIKNYVVELFYIEVVFKEWALYCDLLLGCFIFWELYLGGGILMFFVLENLYYLFFNILKDVDLVEDYEFGFEVYLGMIFVEYLFILCDFGFICLSIGIQDFVLEILEIINCKQIFEDVCFVIEKVWELGYEFINYDFIFGLFL